jgi:hypothetical protein
MNLVLGPDRSRFITLCTGMHANGCVRLLFADKEAIYLSISVLIALQLDLQLDRLVAVPQMTKMQALPPSWFALSLETILWKQNLILLLNTALSYL